MHRFLGVLRNQAAVALERLARFALLEERLRRGLEADDHGFPFADLSDLIAQLGGLGWREAALHGFKANLRAHGSVCVGGKVFREQRRTQ